MARRSLRPQLNQIRAWVRQGRTDAWIAHQLEVSAAELREFRTQHDLSPDDDDSGTGEVDLRDEIEAEIQAAAEEEAREREEKERRDAEERERREKERAEREAREDEEPEGSEADEDDREPEDEEAEEEPESDGSEAEGRPRRRRRRGRRGRRGKRALEATFDHGESEGYGLWFDPAVQDNPVYRDSWAGQREVTVTIEEDQIVIRRPGEDSEED